MKEQWPDASNADVKFNSNKNKAVNRKMAEMRCLVVVKMSFSNIIK